MAARTQSSDVEAGDYEPFEFLVNELRELARILERDLEDLSRWARVDSYGSMGWMLPAALIMMTVGVSLAYVMAGVDRIWGPVIAVGAVGLALSSVALVWIGTMSAIRMKRAAWLRENRIRYLRLKVKVGERILERAAVWLDRGKVPRAEKAILELYFTHAQQLLEEAKVIAEA